MNKLIIEKGGYKPTVSGPTQPPTSVLDASDGVSKGVSVTVTQATGTKCERCWKVLEEVGFCSDHKDLCFRCVGVVESSLSIYELATMRFDWLYKSYLVDGYTKEQAIQKAGRMNRIHG